IPGLDTLVPLQNTFLGLNLTQPPNPANVISFALPILVVVTTWLQFKMTMPSTPPSSDGKTNQGAAMTQSMSTIMVIIYVFCALQFAVCHTIYFMFSPNLDITQYTLMDKSSIKTVNTTDSGKTYPIRQPGSTPAVIEAKSS